MDNQNVNVDKEKESTGSVLLILMNNQNIKVDKEIYLIKHWKSFQVFGEFNW